MDWVLGAWKIAIQSPQTPNRRQSLLCQGAGSRAFSQVLSTLEIPCNLSKHAEKSATHFRSF